MNRLIARGVAALALGSAAALAHGQTEGAASAAGPAAASAVPFSDGEVRKVDPAQGKVTLRHGPIAHLDMPAMTMVFRVADPNLLPGLRPGDKVRFAVSRVDGSLAVTAIQRAP